MVEGGRLSDLKKVLIGNFRLLPSCAYPASTIFLDDVTMKGDKYKIEIEMSLKIEVVSIKPDIEDSFKQLESLLWKITETGHKGVLPVLIDNLGFQANGTTYKLDIGTTKFIQTKDDDQRYNTLAEIPIDVKTWMKI